MVESIHLSFISGIKQVASIHNRQITGIMVTLLLVSFICMFEVEADQQLGDQIQRNIRCLTNLYNSPVLMPPRPSDDTSEGVLSSDHCV